MSYNIELESGHSATLHTAGKYCDRDVVVTATGGAEDLDAVLAEQGALIDELKAILEGKADYMTEQWVFTLTDDTVVTKDVIVK